MTSVDLGNLSIVKNSSDPGSFSFWDYLSDQDVNPNIALACAKVWWPDFVQIEGFVLLKEQYDREYFDRVLRDSGAEAVEKTINTILLDNFFQEPGPDEVELWEAIGNLMCETWVAKASMMFPSLKFAAEFSWYSEDQYDPGVTIGQAPGNNK